MPAPSTTDLVQLKDITEGMLLLKDGTLRAVVEISAINFELRSSEEQAAILQQFQAFLNSIDFPLEMVVHSRKFDIAGYVENIQKSAESLTNELLKVQAAEYVRFVSQLSELANIMSKKFYIVLPFQVVLPQESGGKGFLSTFTGIFSKKKEQPKGIPPEQLPAYKVQLQQRADLIIGGLSGMSLKGRVMEQQELVGFFNELYNPIVPASQGKNTQK